MDHARSFRCIHCDEALQRTGAGTMHDADGTSNDAQTTRFTCPACGHEYRRMTITKVVRVGNQLVDDPQIVWLGDTPRRQ